MKHTNISTGTGKKSGARRAVLQSKTADGAAITNGNPITTEVLGAGEVKTWRACLYLRISKEDGDKEESESITNQRALLLAHAEKLEDVIIVDTKIDDGWSGADFQRPAFIEMMEEIRAGK